MSEKVSIVLPTELLKEVAELGRMTGEDKSTIIRRLLTKGLEEAKIDMAIELYSKGKASLGRASKVGGISTWRLLDELRNRRIALRYTIEDAEEEIRQLTRRSS